MILYHDQAALNDVPALEMSLCIFAFRFLAAATEKCKLTGSTRQLLLLSGALHASLFASLVYPPASGLRRQGLEV
jgi:hypothetical protein